PKRERAWPHPRGRPPLCRSAEPLAQVPATTSLAVAPSTSQRNLWQLAKDHRGRLRIGVTRARSLLRRSAPPTDQWPEEAACATNLIQGIDRMPLRRDRRG